MHIYGIAGYPLGHSLSPLLHNRALRQAGIEAAYAAWPVPPERLADFISAVRLLRLRGVSLTLPHKETVVPLLDGLTERARKACAVNTLYWEGAALWGENTDIPGFAAPLRGRKFSEALVLGAGGAARAVSAGLRELGVPRIVITNRDAERGKKTAEHSGAAFLSWEKRMESDADLVVNATSLGMRGAQEALSPLPPEAFAGRKLTAYDLVYTPLVTRFLAAARAGGCETVDGLGMFIAQAQVQFRLWTGKSFDEAEARELLLRTLGERA